MGLKPVRGKINNKKRKRRIYRRIKLFRVAVSDSVLHRCVYGYPIFFSFLGKKHPYLGKKRAILPKVLIAGE